MNLADAFSTLAKTGCRLRVEAEGGIILDVSPGCPPVPPSVLQVLAAHRESLVAVLAPANAPNAAETLPANAKATSTSVPRSPYARDLSPKAQAARVAASSGRLHLDPQAILRQARARLSKLRDLQQVEGQSPDGPAPGPPPAVGKAEGLGSDDNLPF